MFTRSLLSVSGHLPKMAHILDWQADEAVDSRQPRQFLDVVKLTGADALAAVD
jgi:hypothetical protein